MDIYAVPDVETLNLVQTLLAVVIIMKIARPKTEKWHNYEEGDFGKPIGRDGSNKAYFKKGWWKRYDRKKFFRIAPNGFGLCEGRALRYKSSNLAQCLIVVKMFNKPLMPCFCKTLVMGSTGINNEF